MKKNKAKLNEGSGVSGMSTHVLLVSIILIITFIAYLPSLKNGFTNWDDPNYVYENGTIQKFNKENVTRMLTKDHMGNYHPLTMLSLALDFSMGKLKPKTYHLTNLLLHMVNTALVFIFIFLLFERTDLAAVTSALFGVHAIHVESVAWISERKDVLYTMFFLASLIFYLRYLKEFNIKYYFIAIGFFILSDLSKGMAVSLSLTLMAIDWLKERNLLDRKVILEKLPFFIISILVGIKAISAQSLSKDTDGMPDYNFFERILFAAYGFCQYLYKLILPVNLSAFYSYPEKDTIPFEFWLYLALGILITAAAFYSIRKSREYFFCFMFFLFNIILVLQILPVGKAIMADRYAYVPSIGFFLLIAIALSQIKMDKAFTFIPVVLYVVILSAFTYERCKVWHDSFSLWTDVIEKQPKAGIAYNNRGVEYAERKNYERAIPEYDKAIELNPEHTEAYNNRGVARAALKNYSGAKQDYNKAIRLKPDYFDPYYNRGNAFIEMKDTLAAIRDYDKVLELNPYHSGALNNRGLARRMVKNYQGAMNDFNRAIELYPNNAEAYANRALLRTDMGDLKGAQEDNEKALALNPEFGNAYLQRANNKSQNKDYAGAISDYDEVLRSDPNNAEALFKRGVAKINLNNPAGGLADLNKVLSLQPQNAEALLQRGLAKNNSKDHKGAIEDYSKVLELKPGYSDAYCNRGIARAEMKDMKGALADYNKAIETKPDFLEAYSNRGLLKADLKDYKGAMADYNKAISINPEFSLAISNRGVLKYNMGDKKGACPDWDKARSLGNIQAKDFYEQFCK
ncbi:MAG: tetratricopeptide repeat protein [Cytophagaceae bacterium]